MYIIPFCLDSENDENIAIVDLRHIFIKKKQAIQFSLKNYKKEGRRMIPTGLEVGNSNSNTSNSKSTKMLVMLSL